MCGKDTGKPFYEVDNHAGDGIYNICLVCAGGALRTITRETIKQAAEIDAWKIVASRVHNMLVGADCALMSMMGKQPSELRTIDEIFKEEMDK
jgi:hypothetical protein